MYPITQVSSALSVPIGTLSLDQIDSAIAVLIQLGNELDKDRPYRKVCLFHKFFLFEYDFKNFFFGY